MTLPLCTAVLPDDISVRCTQPAGHGPLVYMDEEEIIEADHAHVAGGSFWSSEALIFPIPSEAISPEMWNTILVSLDSLASRNSAFGEVATLLRSRR